MDLFGGGIYLKTDFCLNYEAKHIKDFHWKVLNPFYYGFSLFCVILSLFIKMYFGPVWNKSRNFCWWVEINNAKSSSTIGLALAFWWDNLKVKIAW